MIEKEHDQVLAGEPTSTEVTELDDQSLEEASGGLTVPLDDVNNSSCNGNCGC
jgi:hypothetical protein